MSVSGLSRRRLARMDEVMRGYVERGRVAGIVTLVCRHGEAHIGVYGALDREADVPMRSDAVFRIASMTKPVLAAAALMLVEETRLHLDASLNDWLPELAGRPVLRSLASPLEEVVPIARPITLRDLLTMRLGLGAVMAPPNTYPVQTLMAELEVAPGPDPVPWAPDAYMKQLARLPLMHQPGARWMYHTGFDVLAVLLARVTGEPLAEFLGERIFGPLGMKDTAFSVPPEKIDRLATCYRPDGTGGLAVYDPPRGGMWAVSPVFPSSLVSTAEDYLAFATMLLNGGRSGAQRLMARPTVTLMTTDHITPEQKQASLFAPGFWDANGWGFGVSVATRRDGLDATPGRYGWDGGFGTAWRNDPLEDMTCILLTQRLMTGPDDTVLARDFLTLAYQAIDD